jgi:Tol biopolymer transport system component
LSALSFVIVGLLLLVTLGSLATTAFAAPRLIAGTIDTHSNQRLKPGVFSFDVATGKRTRVIHGRPGHPTWSPNGRRIMYAIGFENNLEIWTSGRKGNNRVRVTRNNRLDEWPSWAPGSRRIVVERWNSNDLEEDHELWVMRVDGSGGRQLTDNLVHDECPVWSPDGQLIAFYKRDPWHLFTIRPDGTHERQVTSGAFEDDGPIWSPDGKRILFRRFDTTTRAAGLYIVGRDGTQLRLVTSIGAPGGYSFSPDGSHIAFSSRTDSGVGIYVTRADGANVRLLATLKHSPAGGPTWSPDGSRLVFGKDLKLEKGDINLWVARVDGSRIRPVTSTPHVREYSPNWASSEQSCQGGY